MTDDRSLKAWEHWRDSAEKFDYYVLGILTALVAYIGQHLPPATIGRNAATLELLGFVVLGLSVVAGIARVRAGIASLIAQGNQLQASGIAGAMRTEMIKKPGTGVLEALSGRTYTHSEAMRKVATEDSKASAAQLQVERWKVSAERAYKWRDNLAIAGVLSYVTAKAWAALA